MNDEQGRKNTGTFCNKQRIHITTKRPKAGPKHASLTNEKAEKVEHQAGSAVYSFFPFLKPLGLETHQVRESDVTRYISLPQHPTPSRFGRFPSGDQHFKSCVNLGVKIRG